MNAIKGELLYVPEHRGCRYYGDFLPFVFRTVSLKKESVLSRVREDSFIIFVLSGELRVSYSQKTGILAGGEMKHIARSIDCEAKAITDCELVLCETTSELSLCNQFSLDHLNEECLKESEISQYMSLRMHQRLYEMLQHFRKVFNSGLKCIHYQNLKRDEAFLYFRAYYSKHDMALFFREYLEYTHSFKHYVLSNADCCTTLDELIQNSNMSRSTFLRHFREVFDESPSKWLLRRKLDNIIRDIKFTTISFTELSEKFNFSSPAYFATFCKKNFGKTPHQLRTEKTEDPVISDTMKQN